MLEAVRNLSAEYRDKYPVMGIVVFYAGNPHLKEVLKNQSYIDALDEITGEYLAIFWTALPEVRVSYPRLPPGAIGHMAPVFEEPEENEKLFSWFEISSRRSLPLLVLFSFDECDRLVFRKHEVKGESPAEIYNSLSKLLSEKRRLLEDFDDSLKADKSKMFMELDLFDAYIEGKSLARKLISFLTTFRGAAGV